MKHKCSKCDVEMILRNGKFGKFWACPKSNPSDNHGTISVGSARFITRGFSPVPASLEIAMEIQMLQFGVRMTDLDRFIEGGVEAADDDPYHWMNERPY